MLYEWLYSLSELFSPFNVFRYITFRSFISFFTAFLFCWMFGPYFIQRLHEKQWNQVIRDLGPTSHKKTKNNIPTMGGGLILLSVLVTYLLWMDLKNPLLGAVLLITFGFASVGYIDDWLKIHKKSSNGLPGRWRLLLEFLVAITVWSWLIMKGSISTQVHVPFMKDWIFDLGNLGYILFASLVVVSTANAVNLTDGLDGLAIVPVMICSATLAIFAYVAGHASIANYLQIPFIRGAGELTPMAITIVAAGLGFLWYNTYPAQVFMGDMGSLGLGAFLGATAVLTSNELLMILLGGVFVAETLSVITQVVSFKLTGKRVFKMAPLHHHFELKGMQETKIIVRFWILSVLLAILSLSTLKLR